MKIDEVYFAESKIIHGLNVFSCLDLCMSSVVFCDHVRWWYMLKLIKKNTREIKRKIV